MARKRQEKPSRFTTIHLLSDSTGNLAQHMMRAFLTQFPGGCFEVHGHNFLNTPSATTAALAAVRATPGMVFHAVVSPDSKRRINDACAELGLPARDLTGGFVEFIATHSGIRPDTDVARIHDTGDEYDRRIKAVEYTLEHDDGLGLDTLHEADVVLVGVSRTSKTPTSVYLGQLGYKVANVSLALGVEPPRELLGLRRRRVVGLLIDPHRLREIRSNRETDWNMAGTSYSELERVREEVNWSRRLFLKHGWPTLDVTSSAIEESAARVLELLKANRDG